jgi:hypothetical protein
MILINITMVLTERVNQRKDKCNKYCAGIFKQSIGAWQETAGRKRVVVTPYRPARLHRLAELVSWNRFLVSLKV